MKKSTVFSTSFHFQFGLVALLWVGSTAMAADSYMNKAAAYLDQFNLICLETDNDLEAIVPMMAIRQGRTLSPNEIAQHRWGVVSRKSVGWFVNGASLSYSVVVSVKDTTGGPSAAEFEKFRAGEVTFSDFTGFTPLGKSEKVSSPWVKCSVSFVMSNEEVPRLLEQLNSLMEVAPIHRTHRGKGVQKGRQCNYVQWKIDDQNATRQSVYLHIDVTDSQTGYSDVKLLYANRITALPEYFETKH